MYLSTLFFLSYLHFATCQRQSSSVIVIGAGASGIAAASRLLENGFDNVRILEAENRIGGRISSVKFGDAFVDLGAEWCHGEGKNLVYNLVKDLDLLRKSNLDRKMFYSTGEELEEEFAEVVFKIMEDIYENEADKYSGEDISLGQFFEPRYRSRIEETFANDSRNLKRAKEALPTLDVMLSGFEGSFSFFEPSVFNSYENEEGDQNLNWNGKGYKTILDVLMKKIPDPSKALPVEEKLLLDKEVVEVIWKNNSNNPHGVTLKCADNSIYNADYVLFTPSIGVLKANHRSLIADLPESKVQIIETLGFSSAVKIFLYFPQRWWAPSLDGITFVWSEEDRKRIIEEYPAANIAGNHSWLLGVAYLVSEEQNPNVLLTWIGNKEVTEIENLRDEEIIDGLDYFFKKFLGHTMNVTKAEKIIRSSWYSNPHFRGIYSYHTKESHKTTQEPAKILEEPLYEENGKPIVFFAGEATNIIHYSTVHGAIETGYREADRILAVCNWTAKND